MQKSAYAARSASWAEDYHGSKEEPHLGRPALSGKDVSIQSSLPAPASGLCTVGKSPSHESPSVCSTWRRQTCSWRPVACQRSVEVTRIVKIAPGRRGMQVVEPTLMHTHPLSHLKITESITRGRRSAIGVLISGPIRQCQQQGPRVRPSWSPD